VPFDLEAVAGAQVQGRSLRAVQPLPHHELLGTHLRQRLAASGIEEAIVAEALHLRLATGEHLGVARNVEVGLRIVVVDELDPARALAALGGKALESPLPPGLPAAHRMVADGSVAERWVIAAIGDHQLVRLLVVLEEVMDPLVPEPAFDKGEIALLVLADVLLLRVLGPQPQLEVDVARQPGRAQHRGDDLGDGLIDEHAAVVG
jgi:hypothetical protein